MAAEAPALSVSDAMMLAKSALETIRVRVVGEVTECTVKPGYKAVYFSLKDEGAVMPCLMWRDAYDASGAELRDGLFVEVTGNFTAYAPKGRLQFQVRSVAIAGEGVLRMQVAALARALEAEGLMAPGRKRPLPEFPRAIGLVTSPRGKAVHDVIRTLGRRYPLAELVIAGVQVEGDGAAEEIVRGLAAVARHPGVDVIVLARGGGTFEDLMPFNAEIVARAVAASPVPVVTGIGHEPDTCIADMVADVRASTPTAAAEAAAPDRVALARRLEAERRLLGRALQQRLNAEAHRFEVIVRHPVFRDPTRLLAAHLQTLDVLADSLGRALPERIDRQREAVLRAGDALKRRGPLLLIEPTARFGRAAERARSVGHQLFAPAERALAATADRLEDLSPLGILKRGYAVCYEVSGRPLTDASEVSAGDRVSVRLARGRLGCLVETTETEC
jgi:exodeoxyribonuclease VII large subunit